MHHQPCDSLKNVRRPPKEKSKVPHTWEVQIKRNWYRSILALNLYWKHSEIPMWLKGQSLVRSGGTVMGRRRFFRWATHWCHCGFVCAVVCALVFRDVCSIFCRRQSEIARVLKFEHFVAPAGPSRLKTSGKQLQAVGFCSDEGLQHLYREKEMRRRNDRGWLHPLRGKNEALIDPLLLSLSVYCVCALLPPDYKLHMVTVYQIHLTPNKQPPLP